MSKGLRRVSILAVAIMMVFAMAVVTSASTAVVTTTTFSNGTVTVTSAVSGLSDVGGVVTYVAHNAASDIADADIVYIDETTVGAGTTTANFEYVADTTAGAGANNALAGTTKVSVGGPLVNDGTAYETTVGGTNKVSGSVAGYTITASPAIFNVGDTVTVTVTKAATVITSVNYTNNGVAAVGTIVSDRFSVVANGDIVITAVNEYVAPTATITNLGKLSREKAAEDGGNFVTAIATATGDYLSRGVIFSSTDLAGELNAAEFTSFPTKIADLDFSNKYKLVHSDTTTPAYEDFAVCVRGDAIEAGTYYMRPYIEVSAGVYSYGAVFTYNF